MPQRVVGRMLPLIHRRRRLVAAGTVCPSVQAKIQVFRPRGRKSFRLQKQLIFETMPLTAEAPVSRPWWLGYPDCPCTTLVCFGALRDSTTGFRAEGAGR